MASDKVAHGSTEFIVFSSISPEFDQDFVYYLSRHPEFRAYAESRMQGSTGRQRVAWQDLAEYELLVPSKEIRRDIGSFLASLDNKIHLNRQLNQTLEQMAQALFKSWFVDFDPVIDNALAAGNAIPEELQDRAERRQQQLAKADHKPLPDNIRKLFPSEFELTESLGWVPLGWGVKEVQYFGKVVTGKTPAGSIKNAYESEGVPFITPTDISDSIYTIEVGRYLSPSGIKHIVKNKIDAGSICVTCIGSQMGKTVVTPVDAFTNQQINSVIPKNEQSRIYLLLNLRNRREEIFSLGSSGSTMPILNKSSFEQLPVLAPSEEVLIEFASMCSDWLVRILKSSSENYQLSKLRDTLLPKLISGELRIPEAQQQLEAVLG